MRCAVRLKVLRLKDVVQKGDKVAVIVSDITRLVRTADFLPVVIDEINAGGVPDEDIIIVVATGTHRAHTPEEDVLVCGQEIVNRIKIHQHDCRNNAELVDLGVTSRGTPILIDKTVAEAIKLLLPALCRCTRWQVLEADAKLLCRA